MIIRKLPIIIRMNGMIFVLLWMKLSISNAKIYSHLNVMRKVNFTLVALPFCTAGNISIFCTIDAQYSIKLSKFVPIIEN